jgi:hypothetical protein
MRFFNAMLLAILICAVLAFAAKEFVAPEVHPAQTYPAHEEHKNEGVTVAADPYDTPQKAEIFSIRYRDHDLLPIRLIITNDGGEPVTVSDLKVQLITGRNTKISPDSSDDLYRQLAKPQRNDQPTLSPFPLPRSKKVKGSLKKEALDEIQNAPFRAKAVEPHSTQAGFLFFDVEGVSQPLAGARLYVTGFRNANGGDLMFFEVPLDKYIEAQQSKP